MATVSGYYINLASSAERRIQCEKQIYEFGLSGKYQRFDAVCGGNENNDKNRGINKGEDGLWQTWIKLLGEEMKKGINAKTDYIHIMEDDAVLTKEFVKFTNAISSKVPKFDIMATEMYINPSLYNHYYQYFAQCKKKNAVFFLEQEFTGCLSSVLIHRDKIKKIYESLVYEYKRQDKLIPLDNYFIRLMAKKGMIISVTVPFLTTIDMSHISSSSIQTYQENAGITITQEYCNMLRRELSIYKDKFDFNKAIELNQKLAKAKGHKQELKSEILKTINGIGNKNKLFQFKRQERLLGEPKNQQKREDISEDN